MAEEGLKHKLAATLSADVVGYGRLMGDDEKSTIRTLTLCRSAMTALVQQYRGRVVDALGDNRPLRSTKIHGVASPHTHLHVR